MCERVVLPGLLALVSGPALWSDEWLSPLQILLAVEAEGPPDAVRPTIDLAVREAAAIFEPLGARLAWAPVASIQCTTSAELVVVRFNGQCHPAAPPCRKDWSLVLGATHTVDGFVLPYIDVDCDRTRTVLWSRLVRSGLAALPQVYGRALGRILAHELFHVLSRETGHARAGVAKPSLTAEDLITQSLQFDDATVNRMAAARSRLSRGELAGAGQ